MANLPRGTVTFLFTDIEGSTQRWERNTEEMREALSVHNDLLDKAIVSHSGHVFKTVGDAYCAVFDTALEALGAAVDGQLTLHEKEWGEAGPLRVRMALHSNAAEEQNGDYFGPPLNRVARLLSAAHGGQTIISRTTYDLVRDILPEETNLRDLGKHRLKDLLRSEHIFQVVVPDLQADFPALCTLDQRPNNLPAQTTPFIGREQEIEGVRRRLTQNEGRLITLTGPGGTGKTRLALQIAADSLDDFGDGVFLVWLASISEPGLVVSAISQTLGIRETEGRPLLDSLKGFLRDKQLLLLLDNFEQITEAADLVADLLATSHGLKVVVTSRVGLNLYGEYEFPVPPLNLPDPQQLAEMTADQISTLSQFEAVALFIDRAQAVRPDFSVTNDNAPAVAEICFRLDGLPLAIELAASRIRLLSPHSMVTRLVQRLALLKGGSRNLPERHRTLRRTIDWSYDLLDDELKTLFRRLGVFAAGFTVESAMAVARPPQSGDRESTSDTAEVDLLDGIESLVACSLLRQEDELDVEPRFSMLETIREYASELLVRSGEEEALRRSHATYFLALAETMAPEELSVHDLELIDSQESETKTHARLLEDELDNLRAALSWLVEVQDAHMALRLGGALGWLWETTESLTEGRDRLAKVLEMDGASLRIPARERALAYAFRLAFYQGTIGEYRLDLAEERLEICRKVGDAKAIADALHDMAFLVSDDLSRTQSLYAESLALYREIGHTRGVTRELYYLASATRDAGNRKAASDLCQEGLDLCRQQGDDVGTAFCLCRLGHTAYYQDEDLGKARSLYQEALGLYRGMGNKMGVAWLVFRLGFVCFDEGDYEAARNQFEAAQTLLKDVDPSSTWIGYCLVNLGVIAADGGDHTKARDQLEEALRMFEGDGAKADMANILTLLGEVEHERGEGDYAQSRNSIEAGLAIQRALDDRSDMVASLNLLGRVAYERDDLSVARASFLEALHIQSQFEAHRLQHIGVARSLEGLANICVADGKVEQGIRLSGGAATLRGREQRVLRPSERTRLQSYAHTLESIREELGEGASTVAWEEGQKMTQEQAIVYGLTIADTG